MVADLYDCVPVDKGLYAFKLRNIRYFKPISVKGRQRIFDVDIEIDDLEFVTELDDYVQAFREYAEKLEQEYGKKRA